MNGTDVLGKKPNGFLFGDADVEVKEVTYKVEDFTNLTEYFESQGWEWEITGFGSMISSPEYVGKFYFVPRSKDTKTTIPQEGLQRLKAVEDLGVSVQGLVIGHEVVKRQGGQIIDWLEVQQLVRIAARKMELRARCAATTTAKALPKIMGAILVGAGLLVGLALTALPALLLIDPKLIVILNDEHQTRVTIFKWDTEYSTS